MGTRSPGHVIRDIVCVTVSRGQSRFPFGLSVGSTCFAADESGRGSAQSALSRYGPSEILARDSFETLFCLKIADPFAVFCCRANSREKSAANTNRRCDVPGSIGRATLAANGCSIRGSDSGTTPESFPTVTDRFRLIWFSDVSIRILWAYSGVIKRKIVLGVFWLRKQAVTF